MQGATSTRCLPRCWAGCCWARAACSWLGTAPAWGATIVSLYMQNRYGVRAGKVQLAIDCVVLLLALFVVPLERVFYSVLAAVVMGVFFCGSATGRGGTWAVDASALRLVAWRCYQRVLPKKRPSERGPCHWNQSQAISAPACPGVAPGQGSST